MAAMSPQPQPQGRDDLRLQATAVELPRAEADSVIDLDTDFAIKAFDQASIEQRVVGAVVDKIGAEVAKPSFIKRAIAFIAEKVWQGLNTRVGKLIGGSALGFFAFKFGSILGQPLAGAVLGAAVLAAGATNLLERAPKFNPYHVAIGSLLGITAIATTAPLFLGPLGWGVAVVAMPTAVFIAGQKKLWVPEARNQESK